MSRILLLSDLHMCDNESYGYSQRQRLEMLVEDIYSENEKEKIDLILMLGDYSLDFWCNIGSYIEKGISYTKIFLDEFVGRMPCPTYYIPGNHEQYGHEKWQEMMGAPRESFAVVDDSVFVLLDNYALDLDPTEHVDGTYSYANTEYIKELLGKYPDKRFFLCAHHFEYNNETEEFKNLVKNEERIEALFAGHRHTKEAVCLGRGYGNKFLFRTGQYVWLTDCSHEHTRWGFRDLKIYDNGFKTEFLCMR